MNVNSFKQFVQPMQAPAGKIPGIDRLLRVGSADAETAESLEMTGFGCALTGKGSGKIKNIQKNLKKSEKRG
ncbi:MAG: hypothetical protein E7327_13045 [Clostridiales bacterium]|nr:hypothetical protein [Clostridiales bacterium]